MRWQPISLLLKNEPPEGSEYRDVSEFTHGLLRVMESVRSAAPTTEKGNAAVFRCYWAFGTKVNHDQDFAFDPADALRALGLDPAHAAAADDVSWDTEIRRRMDEGLALVGNDVGTPIIAVDRRDGTRAGYFGPVITQIPRGSDAVDLWDALMTMMEIDGFYELKKTRESLPELAERPDVP